MLITHDISLIAQQVKAGGVVALPTQAVLGLGFDPPKSPAVQRIREN
jgi:L-threonylcarbamoyladenylate synthase